MLPAPRPRRVTAIVSTALTAALLVPLAPLASAAPTSPPTAGDAVPETPPATATPADVTAALAALAEENEALAEELNAAQIDLDNKSAASETAKTAAADAASSLATAKRKLNQTAVTEYRSGTASRAASLLTADSTDAYLTASAALSYLSQRQAADQRTFTQAAAHAAMVQQQAATAAAAAQQTLDDLARRRSDLDARQATYEKDLAKLTAAQRANYFDTSAPAPSTGAAPVTAPNPAAQLVVDFAVAQLGKPYVFAAAGPTSYDCSGLTMAAWARAGVELPHFARSQFGMGTHVNAADLQPGDLVFFYSDLHHVGIYIGGGNMIHAPTPGDVVKISAVSVFGSDYRGAVRL